MPVYLDRSRIVMGPKSKDLYLLMIERVNLKSGKNQKTPPSNSFIYDYSALAFLLSIFPNRSIFLIHHCEINNI